MECAQINTYGSPFNKSDNVNVDETFVRKSVFVHVLTYIYVQVQIHVQVVVQVHVMLSLQPLK